MPEPDIQPEPTEATQETLPRRPGLVRLVEHPVLYLVLAAAFLVTQFGGWLPTLKLGDVEQAAPERMTLDSLWKPQGELTFGAAAVILLPMMLGSALLLGYVVLRACNVRVFPRCRFQPAAWDPWHVGRVAVVYIVLTSWVLGGLAAVQLAVGERVPATVLAVVTTNVAGVLACLFVVLLVGQAGQDRLGSLGLREPKAGSRMAIGVVAALMVQPLLLLAGMITIVFGPLVGVEFHPQPLLFHARHLPPWAFAALCVSAVAVAPVTEEILFRGFLYGTVRRYVGPLGAICLSAGIFSALHGHPPAFLSLFVVGFLLAYLYERTGSLVAPIVAHAVNNLHSMLVVLIVYRG